MANALARVNDVYGYGSGAAVSLKVVFMGSDIGSPFDATIEVVVVGNEQPAALRAIMSQAISTWLTENGYTFTLPPGNINLPTFQKG